MAEKNEYWDETAFIEERKLDSRTHLNRDLYCLFWHADLKDLIVPSKFYEKERNSQKEFESRTLIRRKNLNYLSIRMQ